MNPEEKPEECSSCGFETGTLTYYEESLVNFSLKETRWLCRPCEHSFGDVIGELDKMQMTHWVNLLLERIDLLIVLHKKGED